MILKLYATLVIITLLCSLMCSNYLIPTFARPKVAVGGPVVSDVSLKTELVVDGLKAPTSMSFLAPNDIFVTEKNSGIVQRVLNGTISKEPLIQLNVSTADERGLLGIALSASKKNVFLYYTNPQHEGKSIINKVYRYDLVDDKLANPKLLLDLPGLPGPQHNGGKLAIGPDNNLYIAIGDVGGTFVGKSTETQAQNYLDGVKPDGRAGILRITQDGRPVNNGVIGSAPILNTLLCVWHKEYFWF